MFKMKKSEREIANHSGEKTSPYYQQQQQHHKMMFEGVVQSSGFCLPDVVGSSSSVPPSDHTRFPSRNPHLTDQFYVGSNVSDHRRDELGLAREFQKLEIGNHRFNDVVSSDVGQFHRNSGGFRMGGAAEYNVGQNFGFFGGLYNNGFLGNGGFQSSVYRAENGGVKDFRFGQRVGNLRDSFRSNSGYAHLHGQHNCLINYPLEGMAQIGDECCSNAGGVSLPRGNNNYCDRMPVYETGDFHGNVSIPRGSEYNSYGGVIQRGGLGYGSEIPVPVESVYGPHIVGESLQQYMMAGCNEMLSSCANSQNLPVHRPDLNLALLEQYGRQVPGNMSSLSSVDPLELMYSKQALSRGKMRAVEAMKRTRHLETYGSESNLILRDKRSSGGIGKSHPLGGRTKNLPRGNTLQNNGERSFGLNVPLQAERACENGSGMFSCDPLILHTLYKSLVEVRGNIYLIAKDQHGCRLLQKKFDEGSIEDVQLIFNEIIDHVVELMMNPFGNYLIQKLLDVCNEEQRMKIIHAVTKDRGELVKISLNTHGTRVVQKLVETLRTRKQISLVMRALEPGFLDLIKDLNGNHVVQRCLHCLSSDDTKFIIDAAARFCVEIATHQHGCCVLQRCIHYSTGEHRQKLLEQICNNGLTLAQDAYGNYVVQYIIGLETPSAAAQMISQFEGNYVHLSMQKFSSHVVEKCLKSCEDSHPRIVYELLSVSNFEQLVQDPYANYVLQSALEVTKGALYESLAAAVRAHSMLRTSPYSKKLYTRGLLKK